MRKIYKYVLALQNEPQEISMPVNYEILSCQIQGKELCIWAEVFTSNPIKTVGFQLFCTGQEVPPYFNGEFINTVQKDEFAWHVYQLFSNNSEKDI